MAPSPVLYVEDSFWCVIAISIISSVFITITALITFKEIKKRLYHNIDFKKSPWLKWSSFLGIISGLIHTVSFMTQHYPGTCYFMAWISWATVDIQPVFIGVYQLNRLYHLLEISQYQREQRDRNHSALSLFSNEGPKVSPKIPFILLAIVGVCHLATSLVLDSLTCIPRKCGFTEQTAFYFHSFEFITEHRYNTWYDIACINETIWNTVVTSMTLLLYMYEIRSLGQRNSKSLKRWAVIVQTKRQLYRIIILTVLYMIPLVLSSFFWMAINVIHLNEDYSDSTYVVVQTVKSLGKSTALTVAVWLMQQHNSDEYGVFLWYLTTFKVHYCFCGYRRVIQDQMECFLPRLPLKVTNVVSTSCNASNSENDRSLLNVVKSSRALEMGDLREPLLLEQDTLPEALGQFSLDEAPKSLLSRESKLDPFDFDFRPLFHRLDTEHIGLFTESPQPEVHQNRKQSLRLNAKSTNDFLFAEDAKAEEEFATGFGFGVYLDYWHRDRPNSVLPIYSSLKEELTMNDYAAITDQQYNQLRGECDEILNHHDFTANDIGISNKICKIQPGTPITVDHVLCVKVYTDCDELQREFKRHCRRSYQDETVQSVARRNSEIANWCRLLKECIMFYGETMGPKETVFSGMNARLLFRSLLHRFECPLSTSKNFSVAYRFTDQSIGVLLKLERANAKTRYFDVARFSAFDYEDERLFMGSTLKIVDILIDEQSLKLFVSALSMFEQIINGHFIDGNGQTRKLLLSLLRRVFEGSLIDEIRDQNATNDLNGYLDAEGYDTDAVLEDIEDMADSNIIVMASNIGYDVDDFVNAIYRIHGDMLDIDKIPYYAWSLFISFLDEMKVMEQNNSLWVNHDELKRTEYKEIYDALFGDGALFDYMDIDKVNIPSSQQFNWLIAGHDYAKLKILGVSENIKSPPFIYKADESHSIQFHLRCYGQFTEHNPKCAIFLRVDEMSGNAKSLRIEVDVKCTVYTKRTKKGEGRGKKIKKVKEYRQLLHTQILTKKERTIGFQVFEHEKLEANECLVWTVAVKIWDIEERNVDSEDEYLLDMYKYFAV